MLNQWRAPRGRFHPSGKGGLVGTINVGTIARFSSGPWIVEAWLNRVYSAAYRVNGRWVDTIMVGGHLAQVRNLRTGERTRMADHILRAAVDGGAA
jgi:hypothetical protein